jgi:HlyD family secretion protein
MGPGVQQEPLAHHVAMIDIWFSDFGRARVATDWSPGAGGPTSLMAAPAPGAVRALDDGTLKSPLAGTVAASDLSGGESVSAGSSSDDITITDPGSYEATSSLTSSQVGEIATGDKVQVTVDGQPGVFNGTVPRSGPSSPVRRATPIPSS